MFKLLVILLTVVAVCCSLAPRTQLASSAANAFERTVGLLGQARDDSLADTETDESPRPVPRTTLRTAPRAKSRPAQPAAKPTSSPYPPGAPTTTEVRKTVRRKRITPFTSKRVAARQQWRCAMCGELLTEDFEIDHILSLHAGAVGNDLDNLQAIHRRCRQLKSSYEFRR